MTPIVGGEGELLWVVKLLRSACLAKGARVARGRPSDARGLDACLTFPAPTDLNAAAPARPWVQTCTHGRALMDSDQLSQVHLPQQVGEPTGQKQLRASERWQQTAASSQQRPLIKQSHAAQQRSEQAVNRAEAAAERLRGGSAAAGTLGLLEPRAGL